ncbi:efflux transporter periplasmic adaptor subunit [Trinickia symbiotica]|uniref:Efflux transporter periplasmic adaptor subunit n=1 Tax=Trinickia symbiotica TaxID=863227 RepID=A0A2T3XUV0_9BURK|nr:efflux RND transporter periplasmic adaptor subunit [Trinickia symbiotica]PTB20299.1 efflux transporter periplasmic adaptor subunit [Trinickia symbiotica]
MSKPFFRTRIAYAIAAVIVLAGVGVVTAVRVDASNSPPASAPMLPEVDVATVLDKTVTDWQEYSGRLEAIDKVDIRPQVSGTIVSVNFKDGSLVKKGDVLFVIDPRPYAAEVDRAEAQLAAAKAQEGYAAADWQRAQRLIEDNAIAKRDFDEKKNAAASAAANVKAAEAALETARINLGYTKIVAPVSGRVSRAEVTLGNVVSAGASSVPLTTLVSVSPIYASFDVDEQTYLKYIGRARTGTSVPVELGLADESGYSRSGTIASVDNRLDVSSSTIRVRARFDNPDGTLVPGLYARIKVGGGAPHRALLIDEAAIGTDQDKKFVLVVDAQGRVGYRNVSLGQLHGNLRVITAGLNAGERIIVHGIQRVRPGDSVRPHMIAMDGGAASGDQADAKTASADSSNS